MLDLTFATPTSAESITSWAVANDATTGSDHEVFRFDITTAPLEETVTHPISQRFNFKKANWTRFNTTLNHLAQDAL